jgi:hypothetical protein
VFTYLALIYSKRTSIGRYLLHWWPHITIIQEPKPKENKGWITRSSKGKQHDWGGGWGRKGLVWKRLDSLVITSSILLFFNFLGLINYFGFESTIPSRKFHPFRRGINFFLVCWLYVVRMVQSATWIAIRINCKRPKSIISLLRGNQNRYFSLLGNVSDRNNITDDFGIG